MKKRENNSQALLKRRNWMPTAVFLLGITSAVMLVWVYWIVERQLMNFEHINAIMDIDKCKDVCEVVNVLVPPAA